MPNQRLAFSEPLLQSANSSCVRYSDSNLRKVIRLFSMPIGFGLVVLLHRLHGQHTKLHTLAINLQEMIPISSITDPFLKEDLYKQWGSCLNGKNRGLRYNPEEAGLGLKVPKRNDCFMPEPDKKARWLGPERGRSDETLEAFKRRTTLDKSLLSFYDGPIYDGEGSNEVLKKSRFGDQPVKVNPNVNKAIVVDSTKQGAEDMERGRKIMAEQNSLIEITYCYYGGGVWDDKHHWHSLKVKLGSRVGEFLAEAAAELATRFTTAEGKAPDDFEFVKDDIIIAHHCRFYDMMTEKVESKYGLLFNFAKEETDKDGPFRKEKRITWRSVVRVVDKSWYLNNKKSELAKQWYRYEGGDSNPDFYDVKQLAGSAAEGEYKPN